MNFKNSKERLIFGICILIIIFSVPVFYLVRLNYIFGSDDSPPNDRNYIKLFEKATMVELPESAKITDKSYFSQVLSDGWQAGVIKMGYANEYLNLKNEIISNTLISRKIQNGGGRFFSEIKEKVGGSDTTYYNFKESFRLEFIDITKTIIFEKSW
ncbi:hypothetical protein WJN01_03070 [Flavobacteriaceae bacterium SZ-1-7]|uniref:hypothetical protein n=1 Tax=Tamlana sedimenti TaxID=3134126 RepID=UPI003121211A